MNMSIGRAGSGLVGSMALAVPTPSGRLVLYAPLAMKPVLGGASSRAGIVQDIRFVRGMLGENDPRVPRSLTDFANIFADGQLIQDCVGTTARDSAMELLAAEWNPEERLSVLANMQIKQIVAFCLEQLREHNRAQLAQLSQINPIDAAKPQDSILLKLAKATHQSWLDGERKGAYYVDYTQEVHDALAALVERGVIQGIEADQFYNPKKKFKVAKKDLLVGDDDPAVKRLENAMGRNIDSGFRINTVAGEWENLVEIKVAGSHASDWNTKRPAYLYGLQADAVSAVYSAISDEEIWSKLTVALSGDDTLQIHSALVEVMRGVNAGWRVNNPWYGWNSPLLNRPFGLKSEGGIGIDDILRDAIVMREILRELKSAIDADTIVLTDEVKNAINMAFQLGLDSHLDAVCQRNKLIRAVKYNCVNRQNRCLVPSAVTEKDYNRQVAMAQSLFLQGDYAAIVPELLRQAGEDGILHPRPGDSPVPKNSDEAIAQRTITREDAIRILEGKFTVMSIGRSVFAKGDENDVFHQLMQDYFDKTINLLMRAGIDVSQKMALLTSATSGTIDLGVRTAAFEFGVPTVAFVSPGLAGHVDPHDAYLPGIVHTSDDDYSPVSIGMSDVVLGFPGGNFSLFNDVPAAIEKGKDIIFILDKRIPEMNASISDERTFVGNHVLHFVLEYWKLREEFSASRKDGSPETSADQAGSDQAFNAFVMAHKDATLTKIVEKLRQKGIEVTPLEVFRKIKVIDSPDEWAQYLFNKMGGKGDLKEAITASSKDPTPAANKLASTRVNIGITGRTQHWNKASGRPELDNTRIYLGQILSLLRDAHGFSRKDVGLVHGMSNWGVDGVTLGEATGYPALGISKPSWAKWVDNFAKSQSDYILTKDTYEAFYGGFFGEDLGFETDVLLVFEGNAGVKGLIQKAVQKNVPVIVVPLTDDPLFGDFADAQKRETLKNRVLNIGKWASQKEREKALPHMIAKIRELTGLEIRFTPKSDYWVNLLSELQIAKSALQDSDPQIVNLKQAIDIVKELIDMLDLNTTFENNPNIHLMTDPVEIAAFIASRKRK